MNSFIDRLKIFFLGLFVVIAVGTATVHYFWIWPGRKCEQANNWWDWRTRTCAHPLLISDITGRIISDDKARAEAKAALAKTRAPAPQP
jgi:hypothetical protein